MRTGIILLLSFWILTLVSGQLVSGLSGDRSLTREPVVRWPL